MNLKEEILDLVVQGRVMKINERETRDEILKLIEKRIDSKINMFEKINKQYSEHEQLLLVPTIMALNDLKKEMLK